MKTTWGLAAGLTLFAWVGCGDSASKEAGGPTADANNGTNANSANNGTSANSETVAQALVVSEDGVTLNGVLVMQDASLQPSDISVGLRWNIPDGPFPQVPTTTAVEPLDGETRFSVTTSAVPPAEALAPSESNNREGLAIAYVMAFVDTDESGSLDCRNPGDCADIFVGASPNTLVLYGDPEQLTDFSPLFAFDGEPGITPKTGWSLVHLVPNECEARPTARDWDAGADQVEVVVIGDFLGKERCERRAVNPDID